MLLPYVVTQPLCYFHQIHMTWTWPLRSYLIPKPPLVLSVLSWTQTPVHTSALIQCCLGASWPRNLPSCLPCECQTWAGAPRAAPGQGTPLHPLTCGFLVCNQVPRETPSMLSCWFFQQFQNLHTYEPLSLSFFLIQILVLILCWEKSCSDFHLHVPTVLQ